MPLPLSRLSLLFILAGFGSAGAQPVGEPARTLPAYRQAGLQQREGDAEKKPNSAGGEQVASNGNLLIVSAVYGTWTEYADVSKRVVELLRQEGIVFSSTPEAIRADPKPGWNKALVIIYEFEGRRTIFTAGEGGKVSVPLLEEHARKAALKGAKPGPPRDDLK